MNKILLATTNPSKTEKLKWVLEGLGFDYLEVRDLQNQIDFEEDGETFEKNAIIKAINWSKEANCLTIASDGGITIPVLGNNWNSLMTHRFAGARANDEDRIKALLKIMDPHQKDEDRLVYWSEAIAIAQNGKRFDSWQVDGDKGFLAKSYDPKRIKPGWWVTSLWYYPEFKKIYNDLSEEELSKVDTAWGQLKEKVQNFFKR